MSVSFSLLAQKGDDAVAVDSGFGDKWRNEFTFGPLASKTGIMASYAYYKTVRPLVGYGFGLDVTRYSFLDPYSLLTPYAYYKGYFTLQKGRGLFLYSKLGYGLPVSTVSDGELSSTGGIFSAVGFGLLFGSKAPPHMEMGMGYRVQRAKYDFEGDGVIVNERIWFKRLEIFLRLIF